MTPEQITAYGTAIAGVLGAIGTALVLVWGKLQAIQDQASQNHQDNVDKMDNIHTAINAQQPNPPSPSVVVVQSPK